MKALGMIVMNAASAGLLAASSAKKSKGASNDTDE